MADCLVCGRAVPDDDQLSYRWHHTDGKWRRFEDIGCRNKFIGNADRRLNPGDGP